VEAIRGDLPELPDARRARFVADSKLPAYDAAVLTGSREMADYYEAVVNAGADPKAASNWVMGEVSRWMNENNTSIKDLQARVPAGQLAAIIVLQTKEKLSSSGAKAVFAELLSHIEVRIDETISMAEVVEATVRQLGLEQVSDSGAIETEAVAVLDAHADEVARYLGGKEQLLQFFVGQLMKRTRGKANPKMATDLIRDLLEKRR
jgi:aspartyl-tRNA(Asn)/glutamyl-tRNA(Gln) amidotransferase subunit B